MTRTRSPTWRVSSIEPEGMKKACIRKVLISSAKPSAMTSRIGSSRQKEPPDFFFDSGGAVCSTLIPPSLDAERTTSSLHEVAADSRRSLILAALPRRSRR